MPRCCGCSALAAAGGGVGGLPLFCRRRRRRGAHGASERDGNGERDR